MNNSNFLFVYGTLLPGLSGVMSDWLSKNSRIVCRGSIPGKLYLISDYPAAIYEPFSENFVTGWIVELNDISECFNTLDGYEGIGMNDDLGDEYLRTVHPVRGEDSTLRLCWMYLYRHSTDHLSLIENGDFYEFVKKEEIFDPENS